MSFPEGLLRESVAKLPELYVEYLFEMDAGGVITDLLSAP